MAALHQEGCDPILQDKASGKSVRGWPGLDKAVKALGPVDVQVLAEWDRATRFMLDGIAIMERVHERGPTIKALDRRFLDLSNVAPDKGAGKTAFHRVQATPTMGRTRLMRDQVATIAASRHPQAMTLFRQVLLASASIPGIFPPVHIKVEAGGVLREEMHVDGGTTQKVFIAPMQLRLRMLRFEGVSDAALRGRVRERSRSQVVPRSRRRRELA